MKREHALMTAENCLILQMKRFEGFKKKGKKRYFHKLNISTIILGAPEKSSAYLKRFDDV